MYNVVSRATTKKKTMQIAKRSTGKLKWNAKKYSI